jgi:hypothetical protein
MNKKINYKGAIEMIKENPKLIFLIFLSSFPAKQNNKDKRNGVC